MLDLRNKGLSDISAKLWLYDQIVTIDLSQNTLSELPEEFIQLKNLKNLRVQNSFLKRLPMSLLQMQSLQSIELANNQLTSFYTECGNMRREQVNMPNLTYLSLNGNSLTQIPTVLRYLPKLL